MAKSRATLQEKIDVAVEEAISDERARIQRAIREYSFEADDFTYDAVMDCVRYMKKNVGS